jgi:hypothetical protein
MTGDIPAPERRATPRGGDRRGEEHVETIRRLIRSCPWLMAVLATVRDAGDRFDLRCWVGAGAVRDLAWDTWFSAGTTGDPADFDGSAVKDVDVVYFAAHDRDRSLEHDVRDALTSRRPDVAWDVKNQAAVHLWYRDRFGTAVEPLVSIADAVGTWPETATAVAVALGHDGSIDVVAPLGLDDLVGGIHRRNPRRVSLAEYRARMRRKRPALRWPGVRVQVE